MWKRLLRYGSLPALLVAAAAPLVVFASLDSRAPNDHDVNRTQIVIEPLLKWQQQESWSGKLGILKDFLVHGSPKNQSPPVPQAVLLLMLGELGSSITIFRLANVPFILLMVLGVYLAGKEVVSRRLGLLAGFLTATLPIILNYSRKWNIKFHGAALFLLALFFALRLLCNPAARRWRLWIVFGLFQGLCLYSHPIILPNIALLYGGLALLLWLENRGSGISGSLQAWGLGWLCALGLTALMGAWLFGLLEPLLGEPNYALSHYLLRRGSKFGLSEELFYPTTRPLLYAAWRFFMAQVAIHWMPALFVLLVLPGVAASLMVRAGDPQERPSRQGFYLLAILVVAQVPLAIISIRKYAMAADWIGLFPLMVLMFLIALHLSWQRRGQGRIMLRRLYVGGLVLVGLFHAAVPLGISALGPDPFMEHEYYDSPHLRLFTRCEPSGLNVTYHLASTGDTPYQAIMERMSAHKPPGMKDPVAALGIWDLRLDRGAMAHNGCLQGRGGHPTCCRWQWVRASQEDELEGKWPAVFAGFSGLLPRYEPGLERCRFHVIRLRTSDPPLSEACKAYGIHGVLTNGWCLERARDMVASSLGVAHHTMEIIDDPEHWFSKSKQKLDKGTLAHWFKATEYVEGDYLGKVILVDRGEGPVAGKGGSPNR